MTQTPSLIYAELLSHIRQMSVLATLSTPCDTTTKAQLSDDGQKFLLFHHGLIHSLQLPGQSTSTFQLQKPRIGSKELSWRLPWVMNEPAKIGTITSDLPPRGNIHSASDSTPWSSKFMENWSELSCRTCSQIILERGRIKIWKDLPSDDWAEMMDLWHCHKPDREVEEACHSSSHHDNHHHSSSDQVNSRVDLTERPYGAKSQFSAQQGIGFIDITTFLIAEEDCTKIKIDKSNLNFIMRQPVHCLHCRSELGYHDSDLLGIKFFKWRLKLLNELSANTPPSLDLSESSLKLSSSIKKESTLSSSIFVTSKILSKMNSHLTSKFLLTPTSSIIVPKRHPLCLLLWIFGTSLRFSCSTYSKENKSARINQPAIKVFWKPIIGDMANIVRDNVGVEEFSLPFDVILRVREDLNKNSSLLPLSSRKYQDWDIGLLDRYEE